jgi:transmembrane sensor
MTLSGLLKFFRVRRTPAGVDKDVHSVDDVLTSVAQQLSAADPETSAQWQRLERSLPGSREADHEPVKHSARLFARPAIAFVLAVCIVAVLGVVWLFRPSVRTYATVNGEQMTLTLDDSSQVLLNHTSQLTVTHTPLGKARLVSLRGEAFFNVRHNGLPFIVRTEVGVVRVLGTEFDVRMRDGAMEVGVVRGNVQVTCSSNDRDSSVMLAADQIVACRKTGFEDRPSVIPFPEYPGWLYGKMNFYRTDLASVCKELESHFDVHVVITNEHLRVTTITGSIDDHTIESALATLTQLTGTRSRRAGNTYTLY